MLEKGGEVDNMRSSLFKGLGILALLVALTLAMTGCEPAVETVTLTIETEGEGVVKWQDNEDEWVELKVIRR